MKKKAILALCIAAVCSVSLCGCGAGIAQMPRPFPNGTTSQTEQVSSAEEPEVSSSPAVQESEQPVNTHMRLEDITVETERGVQVYPAVYDMDDTSVQEQVNALIEQHRQLGQAQYGGQAKLESTTEVTFLSGERLSLVFSHKLVNPEQAPNYPVVYRSSLVVDLKTGAQLHLSDYASVYPMYEQLRYSLYEVVGDDDTDKTTVQVAVRNLLRNDRLSAVNLSRADYPLSKEFAPSLYGYITEDKVGLLTAVSEETGGSMRVEFDKDEVLYA